MGSVTREDIPVETNFMNEFWKFAKQYYVPEDSKDYWDEVIEKATELDKKYPSLYCHKILLAYLDHLDEKYKEK